MRTLFYFVAAIVAIALVFSNAPGEIRLPALLVLLYCATRLALQKGAR